LIASGKARIFLMNCNITAAWKLEEKFGEVVVWTSFLLDVSIREGKYSAKLDSIKVNIC
jgi:hypothetical protein